jgi:nicotinate-nucleotide--dimethylbenzimidazole phosphoribosyltransferase
MMTGGYLKAAELGMVILVDGFIATSALMIANEINSAVVDNAVFCHKSDETAHGRMIEYLGGTPLLDLKMRLGEGSGAAVALPLVKAAVAFLNEMASFSDAGVSEA